MAATVRKAHLKDQKRKEKEEGKEAILLDDDENDENKQKTPQRRAIDFGAEREEDIEMNKKPAETETRKTLSTRRIWGAKGSTTAQALYEIAETPQRVNKTSDTNERNTGRPKIQEACNPRNTRTATGDECQTELTECQTCLKMR